MLRFIRLKNIICLVILVVSLSLNSAIGICSELNILGTGLHEDIIIRDWSAYPSVERLYSSNNNFDFHKIWIVRGYDLFNLIGTENLKKDRDYGITFIASDGVQITRTVSQLKNLYYYPDFTVNFENPVLPMIGFWRAELFDNLGYPDEVSWEQRLLNDSDRDDRAPRLYLGQQRGMVSDKNQQFFIRNLVAIVVGEARSAKEEGMEDNSSLTSEKQPPAGANTGQSTPRDPEVSDSELIAGDNETIDTLEDSDPEDDIRGDYMLDNDPEDELTVEESAETTQLVTGREFGFINEESYLWVAYLTIIGMVVLLPIVNILLKRRLNK